MNLREIARTFYILTVNLRFFCGFSVNLRAIDRFYEIYGIFPRDLKKRGISRQQIFRGIYRKSRKKRSIARKFTENPQKNRKLTVNI